MLVMGINASRNMSSTVRESSQLGLALLEHAINTTLSLAGTCKLNVLSNRPLGAVVHAPLRTFDERI